MKETGTAVKEVTTYEAVDGALLEIGRITAKLQEEEAGLNKKIQDLREKMENKTREITATKELLEKEIEQFCLVNKTDFDTVRFKELTHGKVGFRTTPPKVGLLNRKYNWDTVIELLRKVRWGKDYIRTKEEPDKEAILTAMAAKSLDDSKLAAVGIKVDQADKFGYEIKWDAIA